MAKRRKKWTPAQLRTLRCLYANTLTGVLARRFGRPVHQVYAKAKRLGLRKSGAFFSSARSGRLQPGSTIGLSGRFPKGHVPANKGLRRPGWGPGRMKETQFKKGRFPVNRDPEFYVLGALRINTDGYLDMRVSFDQGAKGWRALHRILWEDAHGPVPRGYIVRFRDRDRLNVCLENLELVSLRENCLRNSVQNLPPKLKRVIQLRGAVNRQINKREKDHAEHA